MALTRDDLEWWQVKELEFLKRPLPKSGNPHKGLWSDPGLGKTPTLCVTLAELKVQTALILCRDPILVKQHWADHLVEWGVCQADDIFIVKNSKDGIPVDAKFVICGYTLLNYPKVFRELYSSRWHSLVIDEGHALKEFRSKRTQKVFAHKDALILRCGYKFDATGTPMPNRQMELWTRLRTLAPEVIEPHILYDQYGDYYCGGVKDDNGDYRGNSHTAELSQRLKAFAIRHTMEEVFEFVPEVTEYQLFADIGDLPDGQDETNTPQATLRKLIGIAMIPYTIEYLEYELDQGKKVLCYTFHREVSEQIQKHFAEKYGESFSALVYGGITPEQKASEFTRFTKDPQCLLLVGQLNAAGESLNEAQKVCWTIVRAEPDWSGGAHNQSVGRLKRYFQEHEISDTLLLARNGKLPMLSEVIANVRRRRQRNMRELLDNQTREKGKTMSLEDAINANTAAVRDLISVMSGGSVTVETGGEEKGKGKRGKAAQDASTAVQTAQTGTTSAGAQGTDPNAQSAVNVASSPATGAGVPSEDDVRAAASQYKLVLMTKGVADDAATGELIKVIASLGSTNGVAGLKPELRAAAIANFGTLSAQALAAPVPQAPPQPSGLGI